MRVVIAGVLLLGLGGCVPVIAGGAAVGGFVAGIKASKPYIATDIAVKVANPAVKELCTVEPWKPHAPALVVAIAAFCHNIPDNPQELLEQAAAVGLAVTEEELAKAKGTP